MGALKVIMPISESVCTCSSTGLFYKTEVAKLTILNVEYVQVLKESKKQFSFLIAK